MPNPLAQAQKSALKMNVRVGALFSLIGTSSTPRGFAMTAYRNVKRAMKSALAESDPMTATRDVFLGLRSSIRSESLSLFLDAQALGADESARQLRYYDIQSNPGPSTGERVTAQAVLDAVLTRIDAQYAAVHAMILTGADASEILGDDDRAGMVRSSDVAPLIASLAATLVWSSFFNWTTSHTPAGISFNKQSIAGLDERTTDCCLRAHGQIVPLDKKFHLTGTPRYADYLEWTPFHYWCRTSIALHLPNYDDGLTDVLRQSAARILAERSAGGTGYRNPANAFS